MLLLQEMNIFFNNHEFKRFYKTKNNLFKLLTLFKDLKIIQISLQNKKEQGLL